MKTISLKRIKTYRIENLKIEMAIRTFPELQEENIAISIYFRNIGDAAIDLAFSNAYNDVETYQIKIIDELGARVPWSNKRFFRPIDPDYHLYLIAPSGSWNFQLSGNLKDGELKFPGCDYNLIVGHNYGIRYQYPLDRFNNYTSNEISWTVPDM